MAAPGCFLLFLLLGQDGFHHIAGLVNVGEIDFGLNALGRTRRGAAATGRSAALVELRANSVGFVHLNGTGVGLALAQAELHQYVKNLTALDFQLSREIVDSNLAHPPLFKICYPKP